MDNAGEVIAIFIARSGGQPVERVDEIEALKDRGLAGDRFVSVSERGMTKALGRNRGGICARVVEGGLIRPGDAIEVVERTGWLSSVRGQS